MTKSVEKLQAFLMVWMLVAGSLLALSSLPSVTLATTNEEPTEGNNEGDTGSGEEEGKEEEEGGSNGEAPPPEPEPETPSAPEPEPEPTQPVEPQPEPETIVEPTLPIVEPKEPIIEEAPPLEENLTTPSPISSLSPEYELPPECAPDATPLECLEDLVGTEAPKCPEGMTPLECLGYLLDFPPPDDNGPPAYCQALGCPGSPPDPEKGCFDGRDPTAEGFCPIPEPNPCKSNSHDRPDYCKHDRDDKKKRHDHFRTVVKNIDIHKTVINQNEFPDVDIIGLSIKDNGGAMVCMMNIDDNDVQCQEFGVPPERISENVWRIIETDKNDEFDNGNTGADNVDDAIDAVKSYDFPTLRDFDNDEFDVDLAALGINPEGDGLICLIEDSSDEGTALCEPFKVSNQAISGQITETTEIS